MTNHRVVVTGAHAITALGDDWLTFVNNLKDKRSAVCHMPDWDNINELSTKLAAPITDFAMPSHFTRKQLRSMGRVAKMAVAATDQALTNAGLRDHPILTNGQTGVSYGSCTGSPDAIADFMSLVSNDDISNVNATTYIRLMSHTAPVNIAVYLGLQGRVIATSTACTSGSQGLGYAYEAIKTGKQTAMVAGGAEELCPSEAAIFDTLYATSLKNDTPTETPSPFDQGRDGLVVGEGACTFVLEELEHALARNAPILAEVVGFGTNCDGSHITQPNATTMQAVIELALADANLAPQKIGYINAHGTATEHGDIAESNATYKVFSDNTPISSLKGNLGHTLGACGALESWASINMMRGGWFAPTLNLDHIDPRCAELDYITGAGRNLDTDYVMSNNFAFGGINTSLIFKKWS